jgi:putative zinc finger/helix-turn-helix YgiT family protein
MTAKQPQKAKRPPSAERPFPWRCRQCGKREVTLAKTSYAAEVRHDGRLHEFTIPDLELPVCQACGERVFTEKVDAQVNDALRAHLGLLTPSQIRDAIKRVRMSQKELAKRLGIAEATLSRWLGEVQIQSRSMDTLLRVFFGFPDVRVALSGEYRDPRLGLSDDVRTSLPHGSHPRPLEEWTSEAHSGT